MGMKGTPHILCRPDILGPLAGLGHGDKIVFAGRGFSAESCCPGKVAYVNGPIIEFIKAVLEVRSLDAVSNSSVGPLWVMGIRQSDRSNEDLVDRAIAAQDLVANTMSVKAGAGLTVLEVDEFYEEARSASLVIKSTTDDTPYGNSIMRVCSSG
jgi:L-fucose mutarotase/ribose pyranase (RbsD/FucU family)